mgnify:CR=1 FL=1
MPEPRSVLLAGTRDGEHLRLDREGDVAVCMSHELKVGGGQVLSHWFDRPFFTIEARRLAETLGELYAGA